MFSRLLLFCLLLSINTSVMGKPKSDLSSSLLCNAPYNVEIVHTDIEAFITWQTNNDSSQYTLVWDSVGYTLEEFNPNTITGDAADSIVYIDDLLPEGQYVIYLWEFCEALGTNSDTLYFEFTTNPLPPPSNDNACNAYNLSPGFYQDGDTIINIYQFATVQENEPYPQGGNCNDPDQFLWCDSLLSHSVWYSYNPENNGSTIISTCFPNATNTQLAIYEVEDCSDFSSYQLIAANDDDDLCVTDTSYNSTIRACLEAGKDYMIQLDPYDSADLQIPFQISLTHLEIYLTYAAVFTAGTSAHFDFGYVGADSSGVDYEILIINQDTMEDTIIYGNTATPPANAWNLDPYQYYDYEVTFYDPCGTNYIGEFVTLWTTVKQENSTTEINVYPNPSTGIIYLTADKTIENKASIKVIDLQGKTLMEWSRWNLNNERLELDLSLLPRGTYFLQIDQNGKRNHKRIILH